ncbi:DUF1993 domain-containing protein [Devosia sp. ZB163]|uniref:DUF1993 domain-containing protein n=1 Tax=Devosia sp. ZB163 TaxID=3025938 RepID=UPI0023628642|nr:DUF1993 domain-containing protein [Devosia sp. ZB163]MDC9826144.1 DUF1993 domain-containing protein [Devosia sp. ZB163]
MSISMYAITVPVFTRYLNNLDAILAQAEANAAERKIKPEVLGASRLAPDMLPLTFQVQSTTDRMKFALSRLTGREAPSWEDKEVTLADLRARVKKGLDFVSGFSEADLAGTENKVLTLKVRGEDKQVPAVEHITLNAVPQIFFHLTTAYAILRHNGVPVGKRDFTG